MVNSTGSPATRTSRRPASLPERSRWQRHAYYNNKVLIDRLLDGTVAAAFVWEPALYRAAGGKPETNPAILSLVNSRT